MKLRANKSAKPPKPLTGTWHRMRRSVRELSGDNSGLAAVEFAMIVPLMLVLFFGRVEFSSATVMARTLSDLTSQNISVTDTQLANFRNAGAGIMTPYDATPIKSTITELFVDPTTKVARVQWSKGDAPRGAGSTVAIPTALQVGGTYLIYSEVSYKYVPSIGYVMTKAGIDMSDFNYTRPRQSLCVMYNTAVCTTT